jgi:hypothetical protein
MDSNHELAGFYKLENLLFNSKQEKEIFLFPKASTLSVGSVHASVQQVPTG